MSWLLILYKSSLHHQLHLVDSGSVEISHRKQCFMLRILCVTCLHFGALDKNAFGANKVRLPNSFDKKFCGSNSELTLLVYY